MRRLTVIGATRLLFLMCFLSSSGYVTAQVMSLDDCVSLAMQSNKQIQATRHMVSQYEHIQKLAKAFYFPNVNLTAADTYGTLSASTIMDIATPVGTFTAQTLQDMFPSNIDDAMRDQLAQEVTQFVRPLNPEVGFKMKNLLTAGISLEQPVYMGGMISTANRMGKIGVKMALQTDKLAREQIIVEVFEAYQLLVKAKEMEVVAHQYDSLLNQIEHDVKSAVKHGMASHNDELKVAVKKSDAELKIRQAENGIRLARMNLCQLIGKPLDSMIDPVPDQDSDMVEPVDKDASATSRTEYQLLDLKSQLAWERVRLEKSAYLPKLGVIFNVGMIDGIEMLNSKLFRHNLNLSVGAVLRVPIFHAGETRHKVAAAKEALHQELLRQDDLTDKMNLDLQQQANNVDEARLELQLRKRNLEQCEENLRTSRNAYSVGMETLSDLLTAQVLWQQAYAELVESRYQAKVKIMKWRKAAGRI